MIQNNIQLVAWDLVEGLKDEAHKGIYFRLAKKYPEQFLRNALSLTKEAQELDKVERWNMPKYFMGIIKNKGRGGVY